MIVMVMVGMDLPFLLMVKVFHLAVVLLLQDHYLLIPEIQSHHIMLQMVMIYVQMILKMIPTVMVFVV